MPWPFSPRDSKMAPYLIFLSGTISRPSMAVRGVESWISSLRASRARTCRWPASVLASTAPVAASSLTWSASFATFDPDTSSWRTSQPSLLAELSTPFSGRWPKSGSMRSGAVCEQVTLARHIGGIGGGASRGTENSWATPSARDWRSGDASPETMDRNARPLNEQATHWPTPHGFNGQGKDGGYGTGGEFEKFCKLWATPASGLPNDGESPETWRARQAELKAKGINGNGAGVPLAIQAQEKSALWATPDTAISLGGHLSRGGNRSDELLLRGQVNQWGRDVGPDSRPAPTTETAGEHSSTSTPTSRLQLNERFVAVLMGLAPGWIDCEPSATPLCPSKPNGHCGLCGGGHSVNGSDDGARLLAALEATCSG